MREPHNAVKGAFWAIMLIHCCQPALVFSDSSWQSLQSVSIIAAFPVAFVILLIIASFLKDASDYLKS
ncbi:MAG: BCCT family transporter [Pilosibacter sp.]